jgi:hypothetical protein
MDEDRRIRFMIAPLLFLGSLIWGYAGDPSVHLARVLLGLDLKDASSLIVAVTAGGLAVFVFGFVIGTTTYVVLRLIAFCINRVALLGNKYKDHLSSGWREIFEKMHVGSGCHEIVLSSDALARVWKAIKMPGEPIPDQELFAGVTFDHGVLSKDHNGVHRWLVRRWSAFCVAATSVMALLLSLSIGHYVVGIDWRGDWCTVALVICGFLAVSAFMAWRDTMRMLAFQAKRPGMGGDSEQNDLAADARNRPAGEAHPIGSS